MGVVMIKKWLTALKRRIELIFPDGDHREALTRISIGDESPPAGISTRWVIDFGTSATVMAQILSLPGAPLELKFCIGERESSSDMAVNQDYDEILAVGRDAFDAVIATHSAKYISSFKRLVDLQSRDAASSFSDDVISELVAQFLVKAVQQERAPLADEPDAKLTRVPNKPRDVEPEIPPLPLDASSRIVVSVPNSFNSAAVRLITRGVVKGLSALGTEEIEEDQIRTIRESEAIGALFLFHDSVGNAPVEENRSAPMTWVPLNGATASRAQARSVSERDSVVVLDVGGGTTDMTVFSIDRSAGEAPELTVLMNAGVPLGGTDVDVILLRSIVSKDVSAEEMSRWGASQKVDPLITARESKLAGAIFDRDQTAALQDAQKLVFSSLSAVAQRSSPEAFHREMSTRLEWLVAFSVRGLFEMIPPSIRSRIDQVLLTGRASLLLQIRQEVQSQGDALGAHVRTFEAPYHLKLAVGYGAALSLTHNARVHGQNGTFGRHLSLSQVQSMLEGIEASLPVSNVTPTIFNITLENPESDEDLYELVEHRTDVPPALINTFGLERTLRLGLVSRITTLIRPASLRSASRDLLMWHPNGESYWTARNIRSRDSEGKRWKQTPEIQAQNVINPLTGFPLWYPYDMR
jgi:hypothetical protein